MVKKKHTVCRAPGATPSLLALPHPVLLALLKSVTKNSNQWERSNVDVQFCYTTFKHLIYHTTNQALLCLGASFCH